MAEDVERFNVQQITLSGRDQYANPLKANVYTLEGVTEVDGSLRLMSIGQLCMAICMQRAASIENTLINLMNEMAENSASLKTLSDVEQKFADLYNARDASDTSNYVVSGLDAALVSSFAAQMKSYYDQTGGKASYETIAAGATSITVKAANIEQFFSDVEAAMDTLNTTSQELLIDIESYTAKRDDTYSLLSNLTKSFYQSCASVANNLP